MKCAKVASFTLELTFAIGTPNKEPTIWRHFGTLNVTGLGLGIAKNMRGACALKKQEVYKSACLTLELTFAI